MEEGNGVKIILGTKISSLDSSKKAKSINKIKTCNSMACNFKGHPMEARIGIYFFGRLHKVLLDWWSISQNMDLSLFALVDWLLCSLLFDNSKIIVNIFSRHSPIYMMIELEENTLYITKIIFFIWLERLVYFL